MNKFRDNLKTFVERVVGDHAPMKVTRRTGEDFVVISAEDWEREQETLFVLQSSGLVRQISESTASHAEGAGYTPSQEQVDEIIGL